MALKPYDLRRRLYVIFRGEEGLDYGGLARFVEKRLKSHWPILQYYRYSVSISVWMLNSFTSILYDRHVCFVCQGVVFPPFSWSPEPHVLSIWVCRQEQLLSADKSCLHHQPRPPVLLLLHWPLYRNGKCLHAHFSCAHIQMTEWIKVKVKTFNQFW